MNRSLRHSLFGGALLALAGCGMMRGHGGMMHGGMDGPAAHARLAATSGNTASGMVMFHATADGVMLHAMVSGLKPGQAHGFHIHEKGDCSAPDGTSAGGHYNPGGKPHGPQDGEHHAGDLPALVADAQGRADMRVLIRGLGIGSGAADIVGRGLIVHAQPDDFATQPTGNSGARIACAVIERVK